MDVITPNFKALENNIIDVIKEEQIKLGYKSETIRLYYPMESVNHLLATEFTLEELPAVLDQFCTYVSMRLGKVEQSNKDTRFCFLIPPSGVTYVHKEVEDRHFLREFIETIREHNCTLEKLLDVFRRYSDKVVCEETKHGEFDYLVYFEQEQPDAFLYCIKFEGSHAIYHRFTKADYDSFGF